MLLFYALWKEYYIGDDQVRVSFRSQLFLSCEEFL